MLSAFEILIEYFPQEAFEILPNCVMCLLQCSRESKPHGSGDFAKLQRESCLEKKVKKREFGKSY